MPTAGACDQHGPVAASSAHRNRAVGEALTECRRLRIGTSVPDQETGEREPLSRELLAMVHPAGPEHSAVLSASLWLCECIKIHVFLSSCLAGWHPPETGSMADS
jgi:hypothetical protein